MRHNADTFGEPRDVFLVDDLDGVNHDSILALMCQWWKKPIRTSLIVIAPTEVIAQ